MYYLTIIISFNTSKGMKNIKWLHGLFHNRLHFMFVSFSFFMNNWHSLYFGDHVYIHVWCHSFDIQIQWLL